MTNPLTLWLLGDGKPGHENQALGLAEALARRVPCVVHRISLAGKSGPLARIKAALRASEGLPKPDLVIGAGHATHCSLLWLARKHRAWSIVLMKPSVPTSWFDLCVVPIHDFSSKINCSNIIVTQGALNRVLPPPVSGRSGKIILIGGPSSSHGWDGENLLAAVADISTDGEWQLTDSRRTPTGFIGEIATCLPEIQIFPHQQTTPEWLPGQLAIAEEVWVTEDSVSMVYEALSSGARTGLLPVPRLAESSRVLRGLEKLVRENFITPYAVWEKSRQLRAPPSILREADRCADWIIRVLSL